MTKEHQKHIKKNFNYNSYLFNELVHGTQTDLQDDNETNTYDNLEIFVTSTVKYIHKHIPQLIENVQKL